MKPETGNWEQARRKDIRQAWKRADGRDPARNSEKQNPAITQHAAPRTQHSFPFKWLWAMVLVWGLAMGGPAMAHALTIVDDLGHEISLREPAKRIIPLYGAFAEMLYALGAGKEIAARTQADQFPAEIVKLPSVGTHMRPNVEMIIGLKPDLVVQSASRWEVTSEMERLQGAGIPVAVFSPNTFDEVFATMERLATLVGRSDQARQVVAGMKMRLAAVKEHLPNARQGRKVFFEVRSEPLTAAGRGSIVQEILTAAGAENVIKSAKAIVQFNFEALLAADPDFYLIQRGPMSRNPLPPDKRPHFGQLRAVRQGKVIFVDEYLYSRPGPRCIEAVEQLARALYPERF